MKKVIPVAEVAVVVALFFSLRILLKNSSLAEWQQATFGAAPLSSSILFFALPMLLLLALRRNPGAYGLTTNRPGYHLRIALPAIAVIVPVTFLFPLLGLLDTDPKQWLGGSILAALGLNAEEFEKSSDSSTLFQALDDRIVTGPTGNNVRDLRLLVSD